MKTAVIIGKFLPLHLGHVYLVDFARSWCQRKNVDLIVILCARTDEPIGFVQRWSWMQETFGGMAGVHLRYLYEDLPQQPSEHPQFWSIWKTKIESEVNHLYGQVRPIDFVFTSENYGWNLARVLNAEHIPVDPNRQTIEMSGTAIRQNVMEKWDWLVPAARSHFAHPIHICGPESTGKTNLAERLADRFRTIWVPEYGRTYCESRAMGLDDLRPSDMDVIAQGHRAAVRAASRQCNRFWCIDTDAFATDWFARIYFGKSSPIIEEALQSHRSSFTLLLRPNMPWIADPLRNLPHSRDKFFDDYRCWLESKAIPYGIIDASTWFDRREQAIGLIEQFLTKENIPYVGK